MLTETDVQNLSRLAIQRAGGVAWRNNRGALPDQRGIPVRFGLGNDSARLSETFKTGDLVGLYPCRVQLLDAGSMPVPVYSLGIFCMWECKPPAWRWRGVQHERAQLAAIKFVRGHGGRAGFVTEPDEAVAIMRGESQGAAHG